jgi:hypothetical protein
MQVDHLYPYLVPQAYAAYQMGASDGMLEPLGHGIFVALIFDEGGLVRGATPEDLRALQLSPAAARARALENLEALAKRGALGMKLWPQGPKGAPFMLVGGHWAAATAILLPRLRRTALEKLGDGPVCASIPHREALLFFPCGTREVRDAMRAMVRANEADGAKPLTWSLFSVTGAGVEPYPDD